MGVFYREHREEIQQIKKECQKQLLEDIIPFWEERAPDQEYGGFFQFFDRKGRLYCHQKEGWFQGRNLYMFSAFYRNIEQRAKWLQAAEKGYSFLVGKAALEDGRFSFRMEQDGTKKEGAVSIFTDFFAAEGISQFLGITGKNGEEGRKLLDQIVKQIFKHLQDKNVLDMEQIPDGYEKHAINFMTILIILECRNILGTKYDEKLHECIKNSLYKFASDRYEAVFEYIAADKRKAPGECGRIMDPGHTMESLWFAMEAGIETNHPEYAKRAEKILDWVLLKCWDQEYGGFFLKTDYTGGKPQHPYDAETYGGCLVQWCDKVWWVQAEGLLALGMSALLNENKKHLEYFFRQYQYVKEHFMDREYGEWFPILKRNGEIILDDKGFAQKGPYHVPRCMMKLTMFIEMWLESQEETL